MKQVLRNIILICAVSYAVIFGVSFLVAEDLWEDHNPFSSTGALQSGQILKLIVDEPMAIDQEYDRNSDSKIVIKMAPDKKITEFLPPANVDKSLTGSSKGRLKSRGRIRFKMAVTVEDVDEGETVHFRGNRLIAYESGKNRQEIVISGKVSKSDVSVKREIKSSSVADLRIEIQGGPVPASKNIQMKTAPDGEPGEPPVPSANLSDGEKQQILLEYLNRILGESADK